LPARAADGSELPGHVRSPAGPARRARRPGRELSGFAVATTPRPAGRFYWWTLLRMMKMSVLGAGAWGTPLAIQAAAAGHAVSLWGRDAAAIDQMRASRRNAAYLPDSELPVALALTADRSASIA